jgi:hypothetical protein
MSKDKGINVQNETSVIQIVKLGPDLTLVLKPKGAIGGGDASYIPEKYVDNMSLRRMERNKVVSRITNGEATVKENEAIAERDRKSAERVSSVMDTIDLSGNDDFVQVQCSGITSTGQRCSRKALATVGAIKEAPAFCKSHKDTDPSLFEKDSNGDWVAKTAQEV